MLTGTKTTAAITLVSFLRGYKPGFIDAREVWEAFDSHPYGILVATDDEIFETRAFKLHAYTGVAAFIDRTDESVAIWDA